MYNLDTILYILQVYDWHNGIEWNNVAKIGVFDWFAKMLHNECHIVWHRYSNITFVNYTKP